MKTVLSLYAIRDENISSEVLPRLAPIIPHSEEYGSVEVDLVARVPHDYPLFKNYNAD